jgi:thioredoxin reductase
MSLPSREARSPISAATAITRDVLVAGGGPAGCWAALQAASAKAKVIDKGCCSSSGATASARSGTYPRTRRSGKRQ